MEATGLNIGLLAINGLSVDRDFILLVKVTPPLTFDWVHFEVLLSSLHRKSTAVTNRTFSGSYMDDDIGKKGNAGGQGFNAGLIVLLVVVGMLVTFLVGNYILYVYAQKTLPPKKKKPVSKKKLKKERLRRGVSAPGE